MRKMLGLAAFLVLTKSAWSEKPRALSLTDWSHGSLRDEISPYWRYGGLILGFAIGFVTHELGHLGSLAIMGDLDKTHWDGAYLRLEPRVSDSHTRISVASGFIAEIVSAEIMLGVSAIPKNSPFVLGWLTWNILNPLGYVIANELFDYPGDLALYKKTGGNVYILEGVIGAHAVISAIRLWYNDEFQLFLRPEKSGAAAALSFKW